MPVFRLGNVERRCPEPFRHRCKQVQRIVPYLQGHHACRGQHESLFVVLKLLSN